MSIEDYRIDDIDSLTLNCGISPSLKNIEMNQLSDEIMFICNNIIFDDFDHDTYKKKETDKATFMKQKLFPNSDRMDNNMVKKMPDFQVTVENLIEKLEFVNTKKTRLEGPRMVISSVIFVYIVIVVVLFLVYMSLKFGGEENAAKADNYNIGFVSSVAYIYLFSQLKDHYFDYSQLQGQVGHYDENICSSLANIIVNIKTIYTHLLKLIEEPKKDSCVVTITDAAVELYERIYIKDVFRQARAHFKTTVNSINSFIDKQKRYLLKVHNTNMDEKNNNEYMEDFYNILLKGHGKQILQVTDDDKPETIRNELTLKSRSKFSSPSLSNSPFTFNDVANTFKAMSSKTNEEITKNLSRDIQKLHQDIPNWSTLITGKFEVGEGFEEEQMPEETPKVVERTSWDQYIIDNFIDPVIEMNDIKLDSTKSGTFIVHLTTILTFLKNIKNLPEYDQIKKLIFPVKMENHSEFSTDSFIEYIDVKKDISGQLSENVLQYFKTTVLHYYKDNNLIIENDTEKIKTKEEKDVIHNSFLAKITKRKSNVSTITSKYYDFVEALKSRVLVDDDLTDEGSFGRLFEKITDNFINNTENYKLNENIVMRYMTFMFKNDEQFNYHKSASLILSNIRFIVSKIMKKVTQTQIIRNDLMDSEKINTTKYISFLNFESKMTELNTTDLYNFFEYIKKTKETIQGFRRYTKTEEILFSKKEQISHIYSKLHRDIFIVFGIIIMVFIYEEYFKEKFAKVKLEDIKKVGVAAKNVARVVATNTGKAANNVATGIYKKTGKVKNYVKGKIGSTIQGITAAPSSVEAAGRNIANFVNTSIEKGSNLGKERLKKSKGLHEGGSSSTEDGKTEHTASTKDTSESKEENQSEKDKQTEKALSFNKYINISLIIVVYGIFMTFTKSYLMKHEADLQYDKVINVINTTKFETEFYRLADAFEEYKTNRTTENCKKVYNNLIKVLDMYDKCNFIKSSIKSTPFPVAEMWTNGIVLVIFLAVLYITFVQTDVNSYWENQNTLDELLNSLDNIGSSNNEEEMVKNIEKELDKEKNDLRKAIDKYDWYNAKKYIHDIYGINKELKKEIDEVFEANTQKPENNEISDEEKKEAYKKLIDKLETDMENAQENKRTGGMATGFPMRMIDSTKLVPTNNKAQLQKKLYEQYTNQTNAVQSQIIKMKRDTKYVNLSMSILILMFGSYFCVTILNNTRNYQNMLISGGTVFRNCL